MQACSVRSESWLGPQCEPQPIEQPGRLGGHVVDCRCRRTGVYCGHGDSLGLAKGDNGTCVYVSEAALSTCLLKASFNMQCLLKTFLANNKLGGITTANRERRIEL